MILRSIWLYTFIKYIIHMILAENIIYLLLLLWFGLQGLWSNSCIFHYKLTYQHQGFFLGVAISGCFFYLYMEKDLNSSKTNSITVEGHWLYYSRQYASAPSGWTMSVGRSCPIWVGGRLEKSNKYIWHLI